MGNSFKTTISSSCDAIVNRCLNYIGGRWVYVCELKQNLRDLETWVGELESKKSDTGRYSDIPELQSKEQVQWWLSTAGSKINEVTRLLEIREQEKAKLCIGGCCSTNCFSSYNYGKNVHRRLKEVKELLNKAKEFKEIAIVALPQPMVMVPVRQTVGLESKLVSIKSYLLDDEVRTVAIFGEREVGKTTLLMEVNNIICNEISSFELVILVYVSNQSMLESIQNHIGRKIGFIGDQWTNKSLYDKACDILNVLKRKRFVLLLDNILEYIDLTHIGIPRREVNKDYKVVFTTNSESICRQMRAQKIVKVEPLGSEDSWGLFSNRIDGDILKANTIHDLARQLVGECGGKPKILIRWADRMAGKSTIQGWIDALESIKNPLMHLEDRKTVAATNVFGSPITDRTVRELPHYVAETRITPRYLAGEAFDRQTDGGKDAEAREYVNELKKKYGDEHSTIGLFYNATGGTLKFLEYKDWRGYFNEGLYPKTVENGQWGVLLHMHEETSVGRGGSRGAIVYSGENPSGDECDWMLTWDYPRNKVYTEAREKNHFKPHWLLTIPELLSKSGRQCQDAWGGCVSEISVDNTSGSFFTAILSLDFS